MSDTKLQPEDLTSDERALWDETYRHRLGRGHGPKVSAQEASEVILARRALFGQGNGEEKVRFRQCGCVLCICEDERQCHGCGAKLCEEHRKSPSPAPEVKCQNCGQGVARHREHIEFSDSNSAWQFTCQRQPAEPVDTAKTVAYNNELDERYGDGTLARAMELSGLSIPTTPLAVEREEERQAAGEWWRNLAQPVAVGMTEELRMILDVAESRAEDQRHDGLLECSRNLERAIAAVRQQAAQGRKVELGKARKMLEYMRRCAWHEETYQQIEEALAELDAAEKGEGRG